MKKVKILLFSLLVSMVALTGCGKKNELSPEETLKKASNNMQTLENYKMTMNMVIGMETQGMNMEIPLNAEGTYDNKNHTAHMKTSVAMFGITKTTESYMDFKTEDGEKITYTKQDDDSWTKSTSDSDEADDDVTNILVSILSKNNSIKEIKSDKDNYKYEITINMDQLKELASMGDESLIDNIDTDSLKGDIKLTIFIDKDTYNYSSIAMDMSDMFKNAMQEESEIEMNITKADLTVTFSDYNTAGNVEIPSDVIENADEGYDDYSYFFDDDYEQVLTCEGSDSDNEVQMTGKLKVGFNNDLSETMYLNTTYEFETSEKADEFYETLNSDDYVSISRVNNFVQLDYLEYINVDEQTSYSDFKTSLESEGFICK